MQHLIGSTRRIALTLSVILALALAFPFSAFANVSTVAVASDPFTNSTSQHKTAVEPDSFSHGSTIVTTVQLGRFFDGGASDIGFSTSTDAGSTWTSGTLPGLTVATSGAYDRASDPAVAYDAMHNVWLINSLGITGTVGAAVVVNRSTDGGLTWSNAITVRAISGSQFFDKNWIACDNTPTSPFYGRCYVEYDDAGSGNQLHMEYSTDGGLTWSASTVPAVAVIGGQPVVQPTGKVIVPIGNLNLTAILAVTSSDGGVSYGGAVTIATVKDHAVAGHLRSEPLPSAAIDAFGKVYVVWQDCRFRKGCKGNDIVMSTSTDGATWSAVSRIPIGTTTDGQDNFIPGIDAMTDGSLNNHLALTYYFYPKASCKPATCQLNVGYVSSPDGGSTWTTAAQLAGPMTLSWLPNTSQGRMVGDYISTSFSSTGLAHGFFALASTPTGGSDCQTATPNCNQPLVTNSSGLTAAAAVQMTAQPVVAFSSDHPAPARPLTIH